MRFELTTTTLATWWLYQLSYARTNFLKRSAAIETPIIPRTSCSNNNTSQKGYFWSPASNGRMAQNHGIIGPARVMARAIGACC